VSGLTTGYQSLDALLGGLQPSSLTVVAGGPSVGKMSFALGIGQHVGVDLKTPVLVFTMERSAIDIAERLVAIQAQLDLRRSLANPADSSWGTLGDAVAALKDSKIVLIDDPFPTLNDIAKRSKHMAKTDGLSLVVVDRLQSISARSDEHKALGLKTLARRLDVPIVALSNLSPNVDFRVDGRAKLADLSDHGDVAEHCDVVLLLSHDREARVSVRCQKHRGGPIGIVELSWSGAHHLS